MKEKFINNKEKIFIAIVSLIALIMGCLSVGWLVAVVVVGIADILLFAPLFMSKRPFSKNHAIETTKAREPKKKKVKNKKNKKKSKIPLILFILFCLCIITCLGIGLKFFSYVVSNAPEFNTENLYKKESTVLYDNKFNEIANIGTENREIVTYDDLPEVLINAIVATEDSRFFQHSGVDWARFIKATVGQILGNSGAGGASTITMQLSKINFTSKENRGIAGIIRKFTDVYMAMEKIEKKYSKEQIMEFYVNSNYLGSGAHGVQQAAKTYFNKDVNDINLAEAALIAGLFQSPGADDPNKNMKNAKDRQTVVLKLMHRHGYITEEEMNAAISLDLSKIIVDDKRNEDGTVSNEYQGFIDTVIEEVRRRTNLDPYTVPMKIYTTMDATKQSYLNDIMNGKTYNWVDSKITAGIAAIDVKTGALVAVGAGRDKSKALTFNTATQTDRQIGSTSKPLYDYGPGIEYENWSTYQPFVDEKITYSDGTKINNWDNKYKGFLTAREALKQSRNIPALKAFKGNNNANIKKFVTGLGLDPEIDSNGSIHQAHSIGGYTGESPLSMAVAYAAFANGGYYVEPYSYTKIVYRDEDDREEELKPIKRRVMSAETAYMVYDMLKGAAQWGLAAESKINGAEFGAKTGTSNFDAKTLKANGLPANAINDYWVCGVSPDYSIAVWYGYDKIYKKYYNKNGTKYHRTLFQKAAKGFFKKGSTVKKPAGVVSVTIESETYPAQLPSENTPKSMKVTELFKKGTEPTEVSTRYSRLTNVTNLNNTLTGNTLTLTWDAVATPDAIDRAKVTELMSKMWENESSRETAINKRISSFGQVIYKIYSNSSSGLSLVTSTTNNTVDIEVKSDSPTEYVVKTDYTNYSGLASSGSKITVDLGSLAPVVPDPTPIDPTPIDPNPSTPSNPETPNQ